MIDPYTKDYRYKCIIKHSLYDINNNNKEYVIEIGDVVTISTYDGSIPKSNFMYDMQNYELLK